MSQIHVLVKQGETILVGDEVWDSDFEHWDRVQPINFQRKVGPKDVVRREHFEVRPLLRDIVVQIESLRVQGTLGGTWWQTVDALIAQAKRQLGIKSFESFDEQTGVAVPTNVEALPEPGPSGDKLRTEVEEFRRRNREGA